MAIEILGPVRHRCERTNGCCEGHVVVVTAREEERIVALAPGLAVDDPVVGPGHPRTLRRVGGRCVFLDAAGCRIHAAHGAAAKPAVCRQYPLVAVRVEGNVRVGVDSGCLSGWSSWQSGPKLDCPELTVSVVPNEPEWLAIEDAVLEAAQTLTVPGLIERVTGEPPADFEVGIKRRAREGELAERILHLGTAPSLRALLGGVRQWIEMPGAPLSPAVDGLVREMVCRMVWLRLAPHTPHPAASAYLVLAGAVLLSPIPEIGRFGPAFAAWTRVIRAPEIAAILLAD